ncbi:mitochondrial fission process protein 1 [Folsomia candida]|uniref:Mitochondrial fission process protein 1 n=1 Tax=Folsomia candida TaxID=158441 RepID=A0A226EZ74_FOLCA|nr:mitochondrial fission process protein 1 [Folsomia candida]OXA62151.1 Mitochondrial fission process protein 1 [Folsomia candida]
MSTEKPDTTPKNKIDIWRDTPVRLLGYANEVGESFRALVHVNAVRLSYGVAFAYVFADTNDKTKKEMNQKRKIIAAADTLIWQTLASVAIPGFTINRLCALSLFLLSKNKKLSLPMRKWTTTAIGLASIPFIVKPIDHGVDFLMESTFRKFFHPEIGP